MSERLVPDWVEIDFDTTLDPIRTIWCYGNGRGAVLAVWHSLTAPGQMNQECLRDLLPALQFFAEHGRLPTREDETTNNLSIAKKLIGDPAAQEGSDE